MTDREKILTILKSAEALPFLFVGSGIPRRYLQMENWENLLRLFATKVDPSPFYFEKLRDQAKQDITAKGLDPEFVSVLYPKIADLIEEAFNQKWYDAPEFEKSRTTFSLEVRKGISPFKIELSEYCKSILSRNLLLQDEIRLLKQLSVQSIAGIITTNYDCLLESLFPDLEPYVGQEELIFSDHHSVNEIYKIHGCCKKPQSIVINSNDYAEYEKRNAYLAAKLLTVFVEHPIVFLGYSIQDENVKKILEAIINCLNTENLSKLKDRLIFVEWNQDSAGLQVSSYSKDFGNKKSIQMTKIEVQNYGELYEILLQIKSKYSTKLLRRIKKDIYSLTLTTDPKTRLVALNTSADPVEADGKEIEYVFGIGAIEISRRGYKSVTIEELYTDVLFDNGNFIIDFIVQDTIPCLMSNCGINIPVYKYLSKYRKDIPEKLERFKGFTYDSFLNESLKKIRRSHPYHSISEVAKNNKVVLSTQLTNIIALPIEEISADELKEYLTELFKMYPMILTKNSVKSLVKKLIRMYDWLKYKQ